MSALAFEVGDFFVDFANFGLFVECALDSLFDLLVELASNQLD